MHVNFRVPSQLRRCPETIFHHMNAKHSSLWGEKSLETCVVTYDTSIESMIHAMQVVALIGVPSTEAGAAVRDGCAQ